MRAVVQRVRWAQVTVGGEVKGRIERGLAILLGVARGDDEARALKLARKIAELRIFSDEQGRMNRSLLDVGGAALVVSQFTLFADLRRGRRPYFGDAEEPAQANALCGRFTALLGGLGVPVATGEFGAMMQVELCNDGPVTIVIDSADLEGSRRGSTGPGP